jgi:mono/diheme cytochrome c family protein
MRITTGLLLLKNPRKTVCGAKQLLAFLGLRGAPFALLAMAALVQAQEAVSVWDGVYVQEQASGGKAIYDQQCSLCHGADVLKVRGEGPPNLTGPGFKENWNGLTVSDLFEYIKKGMPRNNPGHLTREQTASLVAFIFASNGFPAGQKELPTDPAGLKAIRFDAVKPK